MTLPPFRKTVKIRFWSLRNDVHPVSLGVMFDVDKQVVREAYRVRVEDGWKWQVKGLNKIRRWDYGADTDQEIFDEYGSDLEVEIL